jgi:hypothetical protein
MMLNSSCGHFSLANVVGHAVRAVFVTRVRKRHRLRRETPLKVHGGTRKAALYGVLAAARRLDGTEDTKDIADQAELIPARVLHHGRKRNSVAEGSGEESSSLKWLDCANMGGLCRFRICSESGLG